MANSQTCAVELLRWVATTVRDKRAGDVFARWYDAQGQVSATYTFEGLWTEAGRIAHQLRVAWGLSKGDRVVLCFGFGLDFFAAFLGCLRAGVLAVPVYPPSPLTMSKSLQKLQGIVDACGPRLIVVSNDVNQLRQASKLNFLSPARRMWPDLPYKVVGSAAADSGRAALPWLGIRRKGSDVECFDEASLVESDVAFLQFTSGSTSEPKGVMVTFGNLMHNANYISRKALRSFHSRGTPVGQGIRGFSWLPQYHDLGLVFCTLTPFASGWKMGYMSPLDFVRKPLVWLQLLSKEKAVFTCAPDFSLRLCARKWREASSEARAKMEKTVDLSTLHWVQNGAEPIRASSFRDFGNTFAVLGLKPTYIGAAYGLAEHVVGVCGHEANMTGQPLSTFSDHELECVGEVAKLSEGCQIKIVDPETKLEVAAGQVGEIWISSPSVAAGYWGLPELTKEAFGAMIALDARRGDGDNDDDGRTFLRTGDLARLDSEGRILIAGRIKDLVIIRGRNIYPQDIEFATQEASPIVRDGCVAAFSTSELGGELEVVFEVRKSAENNAGVLAEVMDAVRRAIIAEGCYPARLVALKEKTIPKTTSGKIQRRRSRQKLHAGNLAVVKELNAPVESLGDSDEMPPENSVQPKQQSQEIAIAKSTIEQSTPPPAAAAMAGIAESEKQPVGGVVAPEAVTVFDNDDEEGVTPRNIDDQKREVSNAVSSLDTSESSNSSDRLERTAPSAISKESSSTVDQKYEPSAAAPCGSARQDEVRAKEAGRLEGNQDFLERQRHERIRALTDLVVSTAAEILKGSVISPDQPLFDAGFDSITAEEFVGRFQEKLIQGGWVKATAAAAGTGEEAAVAAAVNSTTVFNCPTARHMAEHVEGVLVGAALAGGNTSGLVLMDTSSEATAAAGSGDDNTPLAVVGMACRFPGGCDSPEAFWDFLRKGVDATSGVPSDRWSPNEEKKNADNHGTANGGSSVTCGAFLNEGAAWAFDNAFFDIPPAEARCMDPQQRIMLEVGYEALHRAGLKLESLRGSNTGVFVGACGADWAARLAEGVGPARGTFTSTGAASSMLANRLSFALGTVGPSLTIDTACSSSLVALREACLHLRAPVGAGRPRVALVGGVNLLLSPGPFDLFSKTGMLAPDGRCKVFADGADGYGRGEGCGAVVLKRLEHARADGDRVLAVIKGSAVGHNGRSATLTAPNGMSQRATITAALREAGVLPSQVSFVEAHGTGTALGDPVEFGALKAVYGTGRDAESPLVIGAVKSNIGHLEGAAGMSGLIKTILVLAHGAAPPNLHASAGVNPRIDLDALPAVLPAPGALTRLTATGYPAAVTPADGEESNDVGDDAHVGTSRRQHERKLVGGVSSFGFGGTNAHVVLEGEPGAFGGAGQRAQEPVPGLAFLFTGQGCQYPGMGGELFENDEEFRRVMYVCDDALKDMLPEPLLEVLYGDRVDAAQLLDMTRYAQPALFAVECATAFALMSSGVTPSAVMGHSLGELAAACIAGVMDLAEGVRLVAERGLLMETEATCWDESFDGEQRGPECMAAVRSSELEALSAIESHGAGCVSLAAVNGPDSIVLSGPRRLVEAVASAALSLDQPAPAVVGISSHIVEDGRDEVGLLRPASPGSDACNGMLPKTAQASGRRLSGTLGSSGFSSRHVSWLAGAKNGGSEGGLIGKEQAATHDGSESTGSVSPTSDSENGADVSSESGSTADGPLLDGPLPASPTSLGEGASPAENGGPGHIVDDRMKAMRATMTNGFLANGKTSEGPRGIFTADRNDHSAVNGSSLTKGHGEADKRYLGTSPKEASSLKPSPLLLALSVNLPPDRFRILSGVSRAFHSPAMSAAAAGVTSAAGCLALRNPTIPLASNVTGKIALEGELTNPAYWGRHVLGTVRFYDGLKSLTTPAGPIGVETEVLCGGITTFVEVGPTALLCGMGKRALRGEEGEKSVGRGNSTNGRGGPEAGGAKSLTRRWIAAMSHEDRGAGMSGLGHVVGAVRGVHYQHRSYPLTRSTTSSPSTTSTRCRSLATTARLNNLRHSSHLASSRAGLIRGEDQHQQHKRPPVCLLETRWVCLGDAVPPQDGDPQSVAEGKGAPAAKDNPLPVAKAMAVAEQAPCAEVCNRHHKTTRGFVGPKQMTDEQEEGEEGEEEEDATPVSVSESVWLLAGRSDDSYAAISEAISLVGRDEHQGDGISDPAVCLSHLVAIGPDAPGGSAASIRRLSRVLKGGVGPDLNRIVYVVGGGSSQDFGAASDEMTSFVAFVGALVRAGKDPLSLLPEAVVITCGVHACVDGDKAEGWWAAWVPGLLRSFALQYPHLKIRHVDLSSNERGGVSATAANDLIAMLTTDGGGRCAYGESEVCLRGDKLFAPRLQQGRSVPVAPAGQGCPLTKSVSPEGSYVITGGTGGIGLELALRLAQAGAGGVILLSRQGRSFQEKLESGSQRALTWAALAGISSTKVLVLRCDVTCSDDVTAALSVAKGSEAGLPPVRGIIHAACPPQQQIFGGQKQVSGNGEKKPAPSPYSASNRVAAASVGPTDENVDTSFLDAKVSGAMHLADSARRLGLELEFLVLFSSASAVLGLAGEAGYAAANSCLDGLVWHLTRTRDVKVLSIQYGPWIESGTAVERTGAVEALRSVGHSGVTNDEGFSAIGLLVGEAKSVSPSSAAEAPCVVALMPMEWTRYASVFPRLPAMLQGLAGGADEEAGEGQVELGREEMVEFLLETARLVTGWDGELEEDDSLQEQCGMDSLQAVEFRRILCTQLSRQSIPTTLAYDCPTAGSMADQLLLGSKTGASGRNNSGSAETKKSSGLLLRSTVPVSAEVSAETLPPCAGNRPCMGGKRAPRGCSVRSDRAGADTGSVRDIETSGEVRGERVWEEEANLDNALYLLYKAVRAFLCYVYIASVVMLPTGGFFWAIRQVVPHVSVLCSMFLVLPIGWIGWGLCLCMLVVASKRLLVGRVRPGESFSTHSMRHLLWWTMQRLHSFSALLFVDEIRRSRLIVWYYRLLGAKLGRDVFLNTVRISDPELVTVGDGSTINEHADLSGHQIVGNRIIFGSGVTIGRGTVLLPSAYLAPEANVASGRIVGALATPLHPTMHNSTPLAPPTPLGGVCLQVVTDLLSLYVVAVTVCAAALAGFHSFSYMLDVADIFPGEHIGGVLGYGPLAESNVAFACYAAVFLLSRLYLPVLLVFAGADAVLARTFLTDTVLGEKGLPLVLAVASVSAVIFHVTHMVLSVCLKWILVQRFTPVEGVCCTTSWLGFRKQITDRLIMSAMMRSVLMFNGNLGNSLWLMALGGPVGRCVSVMLNKNIYTEPELLTLGDDMHVGFASSTYCTTYTQPNAFTLRKTFIGNRGLCGAGSVTLPGATLPRGAALGPNTRLAGTDPVREGALHLGAPAPVVAGKYASPPRKLSVLENVLYFGAPLPLAALSTAITLSAAFWPLLGLARVAEAFGGAGVACYFTPLAYLGLGLSLAITGAVAKWLIIGMQHPSDTRLWSLYHYRTLLVLYVQIHAHFLFVDIIRRGKLFNCYARLLGASVGRDADVATMYFTDHDLVSIGDRAVVQEDCIPHPQFYFEGKMSFEPVSIGAGANAGARSVLLGGATVQPGGSLETLALLAKTSGVRRGGERGKDSPSK